MNESSIQARTGILGIDITGSYVRFAPGYSSLAVGYTSFQIPCYLPFSLAHLAFCAAAILALPSSLTLLRFRAGSLGANPGSKGAVCSVRSARIFSRRITSASMLCTIAVTSME
jgi:hypothetical protein